MRLDIHADTAWLSRTRVASGPGAGEVLKVREGTSGRGDRNSLPQRRQLAPPAPRRLQNRGCAFDVQAVHFGEQARQRSGKFDLVAREPICRTVEANRDVAISRASAAR